MLKSSNEGKNDGCVMCHEGSSPGEVPGDCSNLEDRQVSLKVIQMSPKAEVHINRFYVLHIWSLSMHHKPCPMWQQVLQKPHFAERSCFANILLWRIPTLQKNSTMNAQLLINY